MVEAQPRPFSWSPKVCFTATIPYMAENSTMEIIYTPAFRFAHLWLTSPGGTCNSDEVGLGALQFLERWRLSGKRWASWVLTCTPPSSKNFLEVSQWRSLTLSVCLHSVNCVCIVHLICLNLCVQAGPTSNLLDESELLTGWEVLAIKNRMREVQAMKASARATKASAVVGLAGDQSSFSEVITCTFISWTCSYPHQVFIWLSLYHRSGRLSPRLGESWGRRCG